MYFRRYILDRTVFIYAYTNHCSVIVNLSGAKRKKKKNEIKLTIFVLAAL